WLAARARLACDRLVQRQPGLAAVLAASRWPESAAIGVVLLAALLGVATDAVGSSGRINLLAPPLLGLLAWNLGVYAVLAGSALRGGAGEPGPLRRALARGAAWLARRVIGPGAAFQRDAPAGFAADGLAAGRRLYAA